MGIGASTRPVAGKDILTTIAVDIQDMAESALLKKLQETQADYGVAVIMEVETGAIRAIANLDRQSDGSYKEGVNHAVSDLIEPGSTFKTASMMVALDAGVVRPDDIFYGEKGRFVVARQIMDGHNYRTGGYDNLTDAQTICSHPHYAISQNE